MRWRDIQKRYGEHGIRAFDLDAQSGVAIISDDTQMALYTVVGMLVAVAQSKKEQMVDRIYRAYLDWYYMKQCTKQSSFARVAKGMTSIPMVAYTMTDETTHNKVLKHFNIILT